MTELVTRRLLCFDWFDSTEAEIKKDAVKFGFEIVKVTREVPEGEIADWELTLRGTPEQLDAFAVFYGDEDGPLEFETDEEKSK